MTCSWSINQSHTNTNMNSLSHTHKQACTHAWNWVCVYVCVYVLYLVQIPYTTYTTQLRNNVCTVYIHECVCVCVSGPSLLELLMLVNLCSAEQPDWIQLVIGHLPLLSLLCDLRNKALAVNSTATAVNHKRSPQQHHNQSVKWKSPFLFRMI